MEREIEKLPVMLQEKVKLDLSQQGTEVLKVVADGDYPKAYLLCGSVLTILRYFQMSVGPIVVRDVISINDVEVILQYSDWFQDKKTLAATRVPEQNEFVASVTQNASRRNLAYSKFN